MPVVVTANLAPELGIANGSPGFVVGTSSEPSGTVPTVLVRVPGFLGQLGTLPRGVIPVAPMTQTFDHVFPNDPFRAKYRVSRKQVSLDWAFASTVHKVQSKTIEKLVVSVDGIRDIALLYVVLSRVRRLDDILLVQPVPESLLTKTFDPHLLVEMRRLKDLAELTKLRHADCFNLSRS